MSPRTYCGIAPVQPQVLGGLDDACDFANDPRDALFTFEVGESSAIQVGAEIGRPSTCQPRYGPSRNCVGVNYFCDVWPNYGRLLQTGSRTGLDVGLKGLGQLRALNCGGTRLSPS